MSAKLYIVCTSSCCVSFHGATITSKFNATLRTFRYLPSQANPGRPRIMYHLRVTPNEGRVATFIDDSNAPLRSVAPADAPHHRFTVTEWDESLDGLMKSKLLNQAGAQANSPGWSGPSLFCESSPGLQYDSSPYHAGAGWILLHSTRLYHQGGVCASTKGQCGKHSARHHFRGQCSCLYSLSLHVTITMRCAEMIANPKRNRVLMSCVSID